MKEENCTATTPAYGPEHLPYVGLKLIKATPMREPGAKEGEGREGYEVVYEGGYVSWSPKKEFEEAYKPVLRMSFSEALFMLKKGYKIARAGWNGRGMWISLGEGNPSLKAEYFWNKDTKYFAEKNGGSAEVLPYILLKTADNKILMGWLASQTDLLAEDWTVVM